MQQHRTLQQGHAAGMLAASKGSHERWTLHLLSLRCGRLAHPNSSWTPLHALLRTHATNSSCFLPPRGHTLPAEVAMRVCCRRNPPLRSPYFPYIAGCVMQESLRNHRHQSRMHAAILVTAGAHEQTSPSVIFANADLIHTPCAANLSWHFLCEACSTSSLSHRVGDIHVVGMEMPTPLPHLTYCRLRLLRKAFPLLQ